jgi:hypothetical protein
MSLYFVVLDMPLLRNHLSTVAGLELMEHQVVEWLEGCGYEPAGDGWLLEADDLPELVAPTIHAAWKLHTNR